MDIKGMKVLSVDDNRNNLMMIEVFAGKLGLLVDSFTDPVAALEKVAEESYDMAIVDYMMPVMDGIKFIEGFRQLDQVSPIIMVTAVGDRQNIQVEALESGATDFLSKPLNYPIFNGRVKNLLKLKRAHQMLESRAIYLEEEVGKATEKVEEREYEALRVLGKTSEYKDPETGSHITRVAGYTRAIAKAYGVSKKQQEVFFHAAPLHDVGKVGIPDNILLKPGPLTPEERDIMMGHALIGFEILKHSQSEYLKAGGIIAFTHHERYDGQGYPKGLKGEAIPLVGRIVAVADVFDALTTNRPYKEPWSFDQGLKYIRDERGGHFDPKVVEAFLDCIEEVREIYHKNKESEA